MDPHTQKFIVFIFAPLPQPRIIIQIQTSFLIAMPTLKWVSQSNSKLQKNESGLNLGCAEVTEKLSQDKHCLPASCPVCATGICCSRCSLVLPVTHKVREVESTLGASRRNSSSHCRTSEGVCVSHLLSSGPVFPAMSQEGIPCFYTLDAFAMTRQQFLMVSTQTVQCPTYRQVTMSPKGHLLLLLT